MPVPIRMDPVQLRVWDAVFEGMPLDELAELRKLLVYHLTRRRVREREARR